jgi:DNA-binding GntR family transcriptional regulator
MTESELPDGGSHMQLSQIVASKLRELIISGKLQTGTFLRIDATAKRLRVSMTPVREGLLMLQNDSLVRLIPRRGFVVNGFSKDDLRDVFWAQATIGGELASRAARKITKAQLAELQEIQAKYVDAIATGDRDEVAHLGHQFHRGINLAAKSPRLARLLGSLTKQLPNRFYAEVEGNVKDAADYHPIILDAIRLGDDKAAGSLMTRHILAAGEHLVAMLERQGVYKEVPAEQADAARSTKSTTKPGPARAKAKRVSRARASARGR